MSRSCLWITPKWPLPAEDGARVATCTLIRSLTAAGEQIDLLALAGNEEVVDETEARRLLGVRQVYVLRRSAATQNRLRLLLGWLRRPLFPITFSRYAGRRLRNAVRAVVDRAACDAVVFDGLHAAVPWIRRAAYRGITNPVVIYRAHNWEAEIWRRKADQEKNPLLAAFLRFQAARVQAFEKSVLAETAGVAAVSAEDGEAFRTLHPEVESLVVPIGREFRAPEPFPQGDALTLLFLARLDWLPNRQGLEWLLTEVWPNVAAARGDLTLSIAGSGDAEWLRKYRGMPKVRILGRVGDLEQLYRAHAAALAPIFYGSGTRVKAIEAASYGRACISTTLGVAGLGLVAGESYIQADTAEEWVRCLRGFSHAQAVRAGTAAFETLRERFDPAHAGHQFQRLLDRLCTGTSNKTA